MSQRGQFSFYPVDSTEPGFNITVGATATLTAFESSAVNRYWRGPSGRATRLSIADNTDLYVTFGTSDIVATSSGGMEVLGGSVEAFYLPPNNNYISCVSSTDVTINVTIGYGQ